MGEHQTDSERDRSSFNLLDEPWVPMIDLNGREREVSLREALVSAHLFRDLDGELPTTRFAIFRILLAALYRALDGETEGKEIAYWKQLWSDETLPSDDIDEYLDEWRHRFNLFDSTKPFMQTPDLHTEKNEWKPISLIVADTDPDGALFTMQSELESLSYPQAARWLIHANAFDYSGIKSGAVGDSRAKGGKGYPMGVGFAGWLGGTILVGETFKETLLLNLIIGRTTHVSNDAPIWELPPLTAAERSSTEIGEIGPLALMAWPQRRILLRVQADDVSGVLVANGDPIGYTTVNGKEPMTAWRFSEPQSALAKAIRFMPRKLEPERTLWQGLSTLIPTPTSAAAPKRISDKWNVQQLAAPAETVLWVGRLVDAGVIAEDKLIEVSVVSMEYGTQNASFENVLSDRLTFSAALIGSQSGIKLLDLAQSASQRANEVSYVLQNLAADLDRAAGGDGDGKKQQAARDSISTFDQSFRRWLELLSPAQDLLAHDQIWTAYLRRTAHTLAGSMVRNAPDAAWIGRPNEVTGQLTSVHTALNKFDRRLFALLGAPNTLQPNSDPRDKRTDTPAKDEV